MKFSRAELEKWIKSGRPSNAETDYKDYLNKRGRFIK